MRRRGFLANAAWLAGCAACAPESARRFPAGSTGGMDTPRAASSDGMLRCQETLPPDRAPAARQARLPAGIAAEISGPETARNARIHTLADRHFRVGVRYWPTSLIENAPEDRAGGDGRRGEPGAQQRHPAHVVAAGTAALRALNSYREAGFRRPRIDAGGVLWVELRNLPYRGDTRPELDHIKVERTLRGAAQATTIAHEIFHRVQYAYVATIGVADRYVEDEGPAFTGMVLEGGARMGELIVGAEAPRFEQDGREWFLPEGLSLGRSRRGRRRAFDGSTYEAGLFWKYLAEQHGTRAIGGPPRPGRREAETQRLLLEACEMPASRDFPLLTLDHLRRARSAMTGVGDFDRFLYLNGDRTVPACAETSWGNFLLALAMNGTAGDDSRFRFEDAAQWRGPAAGRAQVPPSRQVNFAELPSQVAEPTRPESASGPGVFGPGMILASRLDAERVDREIALRAALGIDGARVPEGDEAPIPPRMLAAFSMLAFKVVMPQDGAAKLLRIRWEPSGELADGFVQIAFLGRGGELRDLFRHDGAGATALRRVFGCREIGEVLVIVASRTRPGDFRLRFDEPRDAPVVMAGDWNCHIGRFMTRDPARFRHNWQSPSAAIFLEGPTATATGTVSALFFNRGRSKAEDVTFSCQRRPLSGGAWEALAPRQILTRSLETDDECRRIFAETPLSEDLTGERPPPAPCMFIDNGVRPLPTPDYNQNPISFIWPPGDPRLFVVRITATAPGDLNGPCIIHTIFGGTPPPMAPL